MNKKYIDKMIEEKFICEGLRLLHKKHLHEIPHYMHEEFPDDFSSVEETLFTVEQKHRQLLIKYTKKAHKSLK
jgi:hypothetical protein